MPMGFVLLPGGPETQLGTEPSPRGPRLILSKETSPFQRFDPILCGAKALRPLKGAERK